MDAIDVLYKYNDCNGRAVSIGPIYVVKSDCKHFITLNLRSIRKWAIFC